MGTVTTGEAARTLGVSINTVKSWIRTGHLDAFRLPSGHYRIPRPSLDRLVHRSRRWDVQPGHAPPYVDVDAALGWIDAVLRLAETGGDLSPPDPEVKVARVRRLHAALAHLGA